MCLPIRRSSLTMAFAAGLVVFATVDIASAKKHKQTPCSGRFVVDPDQSPLLANATSAGVDALVVAGKQVTIAEKCSARGSLHATRKGWRLRAQYNNGVAADGSPIRRSSRGRRTSRPTRRFTGRRWRAWPGR